MNWLQFFLDFSAKKNIILQGHANAHLHFKRLAYALMEEDKRIVEVVQFHQTQLRGLHSRIPAQRGRRV